MKTIRNKTLKLPALKTNGSVVNDESKSTWRHELLQVSQPRAAQNTTQKQYEKLIPTIRRKPVLIAFELKKALSTKLHKKTWTGIGYADLNKTIHRSRHQKLAIRREACTLWMTLLSKLDKLSHTQLTKQEHN
jgi:hypothetical protein